MDTKPEYLLEVPVHPVTCEEVVERVGTWIGRGKTPSACIAQTNVLSLVTAREDLFFRRAVYAADLSVPDGMPLIWLLRRRGHPLKERVYGPDLMLRLCKEAEEHGWRCFFYGGTAETLESLRGRLNQLFPRLTLVGMYSPPFRPLTDAEDHEVVETINREHPDILWVALGGPRQDIWMFRHRDLLRVPVIHGVGAAFDFIAGRVPQAPRWMMNSGLEWLFRLAAEPRRLWKRYTVKNLKFLYYLVRLELLAGYFSRKG